MSRSTAPPSGTGPTHRRPPRRGARALRALLPALLILVWLAGAAIGGPYFGRVDEVSSNDQTAYLPETAEPRSSPAPTRSRRSS
jgi:RND superfamily putative drug exporter